MEQMLKKVFDYQRFSPNSRLSAMIQETENRYFALKEEDLVWVAAAGDADLKTDLLEKKDVRTERNIQ